MTTRYLCLKGSGAEPNVLLLSDPIPAAIPGTDAVEAYRVSPIFPVLPKEAVIPDMKADLYVGFFCCEHAFSVIGQLLAALPADQQSSLWFSHGLPSLVVFAHSPALLESIKKKAASALRAYERWHVKNGVLAETTTWRCKPEAAKASDFAIEGFPELDADLNSILIELRNCILTGASRAAQYIPSQLLTYRKIVEAVNEIGRELVFLQRPDTAAPESLPQNAISELQTDLVARQKRIHQRTGQLVQLNSALSYVISQAYSGAPPILQNECHVRTYSLLGVGTAFCAIAAFSRFVEHVFEAHPVEEVVGDNYRIAPGIDCFRSLAIFDPQKWKQREESSLDALLTKQSPAEPHPKLVFFSGRLGFKETEFAVTVALQVLTAVDTVRWSLSTISHELLHAHVRALLAVVFDDVKRRSPEHAYAEYFRKYEAYLYNPQASPSDLMESLRFIIFNYCRQRINSGMLAKKMRDMPAAKEKETNPRIKTDTVVPSADYLREEFAADYRELNELLVHVLDFQYFYNSDVSIYLPLLWESWSAVPAVLEQVEHYVLRSIVTIGSGEVGTASERFDLSTKIVREGIGAMPGNNPAAKEALRVMADPETMCRLKLQFLPGIYLADMTMNFLYASGIYADLFKADDNFDDNRYLLEAGQFPGFDIGSPVAFVLDRLRRSLNKELSEHSQDYVAAWVFLACASALDSL